MNDVLKRKNKKQKNNISKEHKASKLPDAFSLLIIIAAVCTILTYIIPSGTFDMITLESGREVVDPTTFHYIEQTPVSLLGFLKSIPQGLVETAEIVFFIFVIGGAFEVANVTGALTAGIGRIAKVFNGKENILIPLIIFIISFGANSFGMFEEILPFITIMVTMSISMGFDSIIGAAMLIIGVGAGYAGTFMNPFTLGVAHGIAGLPLFSGMEFRIVCFIGITLLSIIYVMLYANRIKKNPSSSIMYEIDSKRSDKLNLDDIQEFGAKEKSVIFIILVTLLLLVFGVINYGWYIMEIAAVFMGMSMAIAIVCKMGLNTYSNVLVSGMKGIATGALVVGFARAAVVVLTEGNIMSTILYSSTRLLEGRSSNICAIGMYILQSLLSFIVPSGSGQASISMPILLPIADIVGVTRQTAVIAFQFADGISNIITPTSGTFMAALSLAKIPWNKWVKWMLPLAVMQYIFGAIMVIIANMTNLGPF